MNKKNIAKLLYNQPNVSATSWEIIYFFNSTYFNKNEEHEGNIIEDFLNWRGDLDHSLEEARQYYENNVKKLSKILSPSKPLPKKIIKQMEEEQKELEKLLKEEL
jgi:hypothetical protein